ncbi:helix-turn-helix domain-containing protein [Flavobacterium sp. Arc2]|uniref:helix-turn-helix domain-containing protein n=1 Tax=Flavobacterium sp. Arc2 TaxID=3046685 RepID=UPI00352D756C
MNKLQINLKNQLSSYVDNNREKLDVALLSLRIIKQIDTFLDSKKLNQKDLATNLEVSEAFISQLMSGSKKINVQFINKFEKKFDVEFDFKLRDKKSMATFFEITNSSIELKSNKAEFTTIKAFSFKNNSNSNYLLEEEYV